MCSVQGVHVKHTVLDSFALKLPGRSCYVYGNRAWFSLQGDGWIPNVRNGRYTA